MSQKLVTQGLDGSKLASVTVGLEPARRRILEETPAYNANIICDHIIDEIATANIKDSSRGIKIWVLVSLSKFLKHKPFREMTREDLLSYLNTLRKSELDDPKHRWIGSWNFRVAVLYKFFRFLWNPAQHNPKERKTPKILNGIRLLPRKEKTAYAPSDMWSQEEQATFLKYCQSHRDRAYVAVGLDTSARPHEILKLNVGDLQFKLEPSTAVQYCEVTVSGKTGTRTLPLIDSVPYLKEWLLVHPNGSNPQAPLFISQSDRNFGARLNVDSLWRAITRHKAHFSKLLNSPDTSAEDKEAIRGIMQNRLNPYVLRHTALTAKAQVLTEMNLKHHAGWSSTSKMAERYLHYLGAESSKALLEAKGVISRDADTSNPLQPKYCPQCREANTATSKFCLKCKMVLTFDGYEEAAVANKGLFREAMMLFVKSQTGSFKQHKEAIKQLEELALQLQ